MSEYFPVRELKLPKKRIDPLDEKFNISSPSSSNISQSKYFEVVTKIDHTHRYLSFFAVMFVEFEPEEIWRSFDD